MKRLSSSRRKRTSTNLSMLPAAQWWAYSHIRSIITLLVIISMVMVGLRVSDSNANTYRNPLENETFFLQPNTNAELQANEWRLSRPADAAQMDKIASQPKAIWLGSWYADVERSTRDIVTQASRSGALPVFVIYNIPQRDCGSYSAGGADSPQAYQSWLDQVARGIGTQKSVVILEPDALAGMDCLSATDQQTRINLLHDAVTTLKSNSSTIVYIDAGNARWVAVPEMGRRLGLANIAQSDGFALNVSNFLTDSDSINYGDQLSSVVGGKHYVIDSSRNGLGPTDDLQWCNPSGRALGRAPTSVTSQTLVDAFLWIKYPGQSDGGCNGGPAAGQWWPDYALGLAQRSSIPVAVKLGDTNADGIVNAIDLSKVLTNYNQPAATRIDGDLDNDGIVTALDLSQVLTNYGI